MASDVVDQLYGNAFRLASICATLLSLLPPHHANDEGEINYDDFLQTMYGRAFWTFESNCNEDLRKDRV